MVEVLKMQQWAGIVHVLLIASLSVSNSTRTSSNPQLPSIPPTFSELSHLFTSVTQSLMTTNSFQTVATVLISSSNTISSSNKSAPHPFVNDTLEKEKTFWWKVAEVHRKFCMHSCFLPYKLQDMEKKRFCKPQCFCDDACRVYGDCCPDVYAKWGYQSPSPGVRCSRASFGTHITLPHYPMKSDCPETAPEELKVRCETNEMSHWNLTQPVTDANTFVTYKNRYCAECHQLPNPSFEFVTMGVKQNLIPWEPTVLIEDPRFLRGLTTSAKLYMAVIADTVNGVIYRPPSSVNFNVRDCSLKSIVSRCNVTGRWQYYDASVERACLLLTARIVTAGAQYKNPFCFLCNENVTESQINEMYQPEHNQGQDGPTDNSLPLLALLDFTDDDNHDDDDNNHVGPILNQDDVESRCNEEHHFYDTSTMSCRSITCSPGKLMKERSNVTTCQSFPKRTNLYAYEICFFDMANFTAWDVYRGFTSQAIENQTELNIKVERLKITSLQLDGEASHIENNIINHYAFLVYLAEPDVRDKIDDAFLPRALNIFRMVMKNAHLQLAPTCLVSQLSVIAPGHMVDGLVIDYHTQSLKNAIYLPLSKTLTCPRIELFWNETVYDLEKNEVILRHDTFDGATNNRIGVPNFYVTDSNTTLVCLSEYKKVMPGNFSGVFSTKEKTTLKDKKKKQLSKYTHPLYWVSLVCTFVSLIFLFISFVIYCLLKSLRNIAGINNVMLIVALFGGQLFLQVAAEVRLRGWLCEAVGVATHFSWLAVIFAQNVCTFHMFFTLSFPFASHVAMFESGLVTRKYMLYVIVSSASFVVATLVWQFGVDRRIGYGGPACYLIGSLIRILMFAVPLLGTVAVNAAMFLFTIVRLRSLQNVQNTRRNRTTLILYTKLSVFTGLTWMFGFLASLLDSEVLSYMFSLSHGCQGLFVFLAFLANKRVLKMLRNRLGWVKQDKNSFKQVVGLNMPYRSTSETLTNAATSDTHN